MPDEWAGRQLALKSVYLAVEFEDKIHLLAATVRQ
jgi:hypothetical protein